MKPNIVFMGSPEFAVPVLIRLSQEYPVVGVITQPDRPAGRGRTLTPPPVRAAAGELGLPVIQPVRLREQPAMEQLITWSPDLIVVAAYGQILRKNVLELPPLGCVNIHASLLPRWRGAAPINAAILHGDDETGISVMQMDRGIDTGPVLAQQAVPILAEDTAQSLSARLADLGAELLLETLPAYLNGALPAMPQDDSLATYAPMLKKEDGRLDFTCSAVHLDRQVRAVYPWPGAYFDWPAGTLKILRARAVEAKGGESMPGERTVYQGLPAVSTADGLLVLEEVQPAGKNAMLGRVFLQGARGWV